MRSLPPRSTSPSACRRPRRRRSASAPPASPPPRCIPRIWAFRRFRCRCFATRDCRSGCRWWASRMTTPRPSRRRPGWRARLADRPDPPAALDRYRDSAAHDRGYPDLHEHVLALWRANLLVVVDEPINKDTEMHPLVRWQFRGGIPEPDRKAFLFTQPTDSKGRRYDAAVLVAGLAANREVYRIGFGQPLDRIGPARASTACRCRSRLPAGTTRPICRPATTSPRIPTAASRMSATTAASSRRRGGSA